jgi:BirA family biotin operon repressor/biotin-[acetyl-CoA-carboxylase] ligase
VTPSEIKRGLKTRWLGQAAIHCIEVLGSTNTEATRLGKEGAPEGTVIVAEAQERGRGRLGRSWVSPSESGLYVSFIVKPACSPEESTRLTLAAGIGVACAVQGVGVQPQLKWPNDVLIAGRKVGGILTEAVFKQSRIDFAVVGIGVNVNTEPHEFPVQVRDIATSLRISLGQPVSRIRFLQALLFEQERWYELFSGGDFEEILRSWRQFDTTLGKEVEVVLPNKRVVGVAEALESDGALLVRDESGASIRVVAGDVVHCRVGEDSGEDA